jgi:4-methyl-5(b-hydroxyethyl)-thiazole monophosphate biosynthesis
MLILPGGEPGVTNLSRNAIVRALAARQVREGRLLGAICAAPRLLAEAGLLAGRHVTAHPSVASRLEETGARYDETRRVVWDGALVTSRGPGTALEFALAVLERLGLGERAAELGRAMLVAAAA